MLIENMILSYVLGIIMGVLDEWNKKIFFFFWILIVAIVLVGCYWGIQTGTPVVVTPSFPGWYYIFTIPVVVLGMFTGSKIFKISLK